MTLRVIGAGLGRTGTQSLRDALAQLLGAPCYHMTEVFARPEHIEPWHAAARGDLPDWHALLRGYAAAVDWPPCAWWPELMEAFPNALVVLSTRDAASWWRSADATIFPVLRAPAPAQPPFMAAWRAMVHATLETRFGASLDDAAAAMRAFERHNQRVRDAVPAARLLEWRAGDGWQPLCRALDLPVPDAPFPHVNSTADFQARMRGAAEALRGEP